MVQEDEIRWQPVQGTPWTPPPPTWLDADAQLCAMMTEDLEAATGRRVHLSLDAIDEQIGGLRRGEVCGIMARPGLGKTLLLCHVAHAVTAWHVLFSLEMPAAQIVARLQQRVYGLGRNQREAQSQAGQLDYAAYRAAFQRLLIIETPGLSVSQMGDVIRRMQQPGGPLAGETLALVTIDHLGLIGGDRRLATYDRVSVQAREIKELAKTCSCSVLLAIQVNRDSGGDGSKELGLGAARDSGVVEEAMDYLIALRRLDRSLTLSPADRDRYKDVLFAKVVKNRHGDVNGSETAYRLYPVGLRLEEDRRLHPTENDFARVAASSGRR
jgi:replicative DNA helicase